VSTTAVDVIDVVDAAAAVKDDEEEEEEEEEEEAVFVALAAAAAAAAEKRSSAPCSLPLLLPPLLLPLLAPKPPATAAVMVDGSSPTAGTVRREAARLLDMVDKRRPRGARPPPVAADKTRRRVNILQHTAIRKMRKRISEAGLCLT